MNAKYFYQHCELEEEVAILQGGHDPLRAQAMDISEASMRMRSSEPFEQGTQLKVAFNFSNSDRTADFVEVEGEVIDRFAEPENETWQVGVRLHFRDTVEEQNLLTHLYSCEGMF